MEFFETLQHRHPVFFWYGMASLIMALYCLIMTQISSTEVLGISAWIKPLKFYLSNTIFVWTMGWLLHYLPDSFTITLYNWIVIGVMTFELVYIHYQASLGALSHFNQSSNFHLTMFSLMGVAISIMTLFTAYIGYLFFVIEIPGLSPSFTWGIRLGILLFVVFAFEGGLMGARMSHTVGAADGTLGIPFLNWSLTNGDLRAAHFVGMHALQVLPLLGYFVFTTSRGVIIASVCYGLVAIFILGQALFGKPLIGQGLT
jgi:hypothetical protein